MEEHTLRYGGYIFVVYFWILAAALVSGVLIMLTHTSQVLNNTYYTSKSLSLLLYTQASLSKLARRLRPTQEINWEAVEDLGDGGLRPFDDYRPPRQRYKIQNGEVYCPQGGDV